MLDKLWTLLKGLFVGSTMLVPGVSGGSMAMILGIYDRLIRAVSSFKEQKSANLIFLSLFCIGSFVGMFLFAQPILTAIHRWEQPMLYFFIGIVMGGVPLMLKKAQVKQLTPSLALYPILGVVLVVLLGKLPVFDFEQTGVLQVLLLIVAGFISAIALVLPGISVSYMLLLLGMYDKTMEAISLLQFPFLLPLAIGGLLGVIATTKLLESCMNRYPQITYLMIFGFVIGSVFEILPGIPDADSILLCMGTLILGVTFIQVLLKFDKEEV